MFSLKNKYFQATKFEFLAILWPEKKQKFPPKKLKKPTIFFKNTLNYK